MLGFSWGRLQSQCSAVRGSDFSRDPSAPACRTASWLKPLPQPQSAVQPNDVFLSAARRAVFLHETSNPPISKRDGLMDAFSMETNHFPRAGSSRLRSGRSSESGRIYLVTFHTRAREAIFRDWPCACAMVRSSTSRYVLRASRLLCWVLMPDHWHGLIELGEQDDLSMLVRRIKGVSARAVNSLGNVQRGVWASGFHDHAIRIDEDLPGIARYLVLNPKRAGLVARVGDYSFWDAIWLDPCAGRAR